MLNENALNAFLTLAKTGSFQQAAKDLGVSSASLSRYIAQAEEDAGFTLFHRSRNNSSLTRMGQEFLPLAQHLRQDLDRYSSRVMAIRDKGVETLLIGCGPLTTKAIIAPVLKSVRNSFPNLRFRVLVSAYGRPLDLLQSGVFDVFVGDLTYTPSAEGVELKVMEKQSVSFLAHPSHPIHQKGPCSIADILAHTFASPFLHKHWKAKLVEALGGGQDALDLVGKQPQIESDDYAFLTSLLSEPDVIVGAMKEDFQELIEMEKVKEISMIAPLPWNICAARKTQNRSDALDAFWLALNKFAVR